MITTRNLIYGIRDDLLRIQSVTLQVIQAIFHWRKDQALTQHEREQPHLYPPKPFVYNGHDYLLKIVNDLNFLKEVQPITVWLGQPLSRNPFALLVTDPTILDNLEMQFDGSVADLAACSHNPPPHVRPEVQQKALVHWASLLLLAQEVIYGRGPDPMEASIEGGGKKSSLLGRQNSSVSTDGKLMMGSDIITRSLFSNAGVMEETQATIAENSSDTKMTTNDGVRGKKKTTIDGRAKGSRHPPKKTEKASAKRAKTLSRVHQVISQNAALRRELLRMRGALEMERETLRRLEMVEDEAGADH